MGWRICDSRWADIAKSSINDYINNHVIVHCACKQKSEISVQKIVKGKPETATCNWHKDAVADVATGLPLLKKVGQFNEV
jgi:hypothetical protein